MTSDAENKGLWFLNTQNQFRQHFEQLWGKAQSYLEASLSEEPSRSAHVALAQLFDRTDKPEEANRHYRASADGKLRQ